MKRFELERFGEVGTEWVDRLGARRVCAPSLSRGGASASSVGRRAALGTARGRRDRARGRHAASPEAEAVYLAPGRAEQDPRRPPHATAAASRSTRARIPPQPSYFLKPPSTLNGHRGADPAAGGGAVPELRGRARGRRRPADEGRADGRTRSTTSAGYACANDVGLHDFRHADRGSMLRVKGQDGFLPLGPGARAGGGVRPDRLHAAHAT